MYPFLIKAGIAIAATVVFAAWSSYSRRQSSNYNFDSAPQSPEFDGSGSTMCTICYDSLAIINNKANATLPCKHKFHLNCIKLMHNNGGLKNCPNCRRNVSNEFLENLLKKQAFYTGCLD